MRMRTRAAGILASAAVCALALTAAVPDARLPALFVAPPPAAGPARPEPALPSPQAGQVGGTAAAPPAGALPAAQAIRELRGTGGSPPSLQLDAAGTVRAVTAAQGQTLGTNGDAFVQRYAAAFGLTRAHTYTRAGSRALPGGDRVTRYQQAAAGLPVLGGEIVLTTGTNGAVRAATAETSRFAPAGGKAIDAEQARSVALAYADRAYALEAGAQAGPAKLWMYDPTLVGGPGRPGLRRTWWVDVVGPDGHDLADVLVDALDGTVSLSLTAHQEAGGRIVCDLANAKVNLNLPANYACTDTSALGQSATTRRDATPSPVADVNAAYDQLGAAYDWYLRQFGVRSFDGRDAQVRATVRACAALGRCPYANAFWEGTQFIFGTGWAVDDIAAHEYTHAVTAYSSNLLYVYQSGAINEALSDIMAELIDLQTTTGVDDGPDRDWLIGEDLPESVGVLRNLADPTRTGQPDSMYSDLWRYVPSTTDNGGVHANSGVANKAAYLIAEGGDGFGGLDLDKSAQLWWRVMHTLPSGADYSDLARALNSSCWQLVGFRGFTEADCDQTVRTVLIRTQMSDAQSGTSTGLREEPLCEDYEKVRTLHHDGFEQPGTWAMSSPWWRMVPSAGVPYEYAKSGRGSLNAWAVDGQADGVTAEMIASVKIPASFGEGEQPRINLAHSTLQGTQAQVALEIDDGSGWRYVQRPDTLESWGFSTTVGDLGHYAGKTLRFRFKVHTYDGTVSLDTYLDDFHVYQCLPATTPVVDAHGHLDGDTARISWKPKRSSDSIASYQVVFDPAVTGGPFTVTEPGLVVTGVDPVNTYRVTITPVGDNGVHGEPVTIRVAASPPLDCQHVVSLWSSWAPIARKLRTGCHPLPLTPRR